MEADRHLSAADMVNDHRKVGALAAIAVDTGGGNLELVRPMTGRHLGSADRLPGGQRA